MSRAESLTSATVCICDSRLPLASTLDASSTATTRPLESRIGAAEHDSPTWRQRKWSDW